MRWDSGGGWLTRSEQKDADVIYRAGIGQLKVGVSVVDLLQVGLDDAACDDAPEHGSLDGTCVSGPNGVGGECRSVLL